eukprot:g1282.t1
MGKKKSKKKERLKDNAKREGKARKAKERKSRRHRKALESRKKCSSDFQKLSEQIRPQNLRLRSVEADGNCCFRSIADQLVGKPSMHAAYRKKACAYMEENRTKFEPFLPLDDDNETWMSYLSSMKSDGEWAGQLELKAIADATRIHIVVHQLDNPRWILSSSFPTTQYIHLAYTGGAHYDSIRRMDECNSNVPISLDADGRPAKRSVRKGEEDDFKEEASKTEAFLMRASRSSSLRRVRFVLGLHNGNVDGALKQLVKEQEDADNDARSTNVPPKGEEKDILEDTVTPVPDSKRRRKVKIGRNKPCPCGSGRRFKHCCKSGARPEKKLSNKERKRLQKEEKRVTAVSRSEKDSHMASGGDACVKSLVEDMGSMRV